MKFSIIFIFLIIGFSYSHTLNSQYIYSFPDEWSFFMIDIKTGEALYNQSLPDTFSVQQVNSINNNTLSLFGYFQNLDASLYLTLDYNFESNTFSNYNLNNGINDSCECGNAIQNYVVYDNNYFIPRVNLINITTDLTILNLNFNTLKDNEIYISMPDYNQSIIPLAALNQQKNVIYILFYGEGLDNPQLYLSTLQLPIQNYIINDIEIIKLPIEGTNSIPFNFLGGELFTIFNNGISTLYYVQKYQKNITIYEIDPNNSSVQIVASFAISSYNGLFASYFFTSNNKYLVILDFGDGESTSTVYYRFVDLSTFKVVYSFSSSNFYIGRLDSFDLTFYFNGSF